MKRWLVRICVLLVLGAIINVAVAWIPVFCSPLVAHESIKGGPQAEEFARDLGIQRHADDSILYASSRAPGLELCGVVTEASTPGQPSSLAFRYSAGIPCKALRATGVGQGMTFVQTLKSMKIDGIRLPSVDFKGERLVRILPLRPLSPGFAINTLFYAAVLWLLFAAPFALRRRRRIKRGLCPKCAYPVGTNAVCTECGKPVTAAKAT